MRAIVCGVDIVDSEGFLMDAQGLDSGFSMASTSLANKNLLRLHEYSPFSKTFHRLRLEELQAQDSIFKEQLLFFQRAFSLSTQSLYPARVSFPTGRYLRQVMEADLNLEIK